MSLIVDCSFDCTRFLPALKEAGVISIGRYISRGGGSKCATPAEAEAFQKCGMKMFLIYEMFGRPFGAATGQQDGKFAVHQAKALGAPLDGSTFIANAEDWDPPMSVMGAIKADAAAFKAAIAPAFKLWEYASGGVNDELYADEMIDGRWITQSHGFRGSPAAIAGARYEMLQKLPIRIHGLEFDPNVMRDPNVVPGFIPFAAA